MEGGGRERLFTYHYINCHHQNDSCIKIGTVLSCPKIPVWPCCVRAFRKQTDKHSPEMLPVGLRDRNHAQTTAVQMAAPAVTKESASFFFLFFSLSLSLSLSLSPSLSPTHIRHRGYAVPAKMYLLHFTPVHPVLTWGVIGEMINHPLNFYDVFQ